MNKFYIIYMVILGFVIASCDSFEDGGTSFTDLEFQRESLIITWINDDVILDNVNVTSEFQGFQLVHNEIFQC